MEKLEQRKFLVENPLGRREDLEKIMSQEEMNGLALTGEINLSKANYKTNKSCIELYNSFDKKTTFFDKLMGLYCHYILGW